MAVTASSTEYQCVVVGDEPGGLWLLKRLAQFVPAWREKGELLWLRLGAAAPRPVPAPIRLLRGFEPMTFGPSWAAELKLPGGTVRWDAEGLARAFPELPAPFDLPDVSPHPKFPPPYQAAVRFALRHRPELLSYASGVWKRLGRARRLQAEPLVLLALQCRELAWWDAASDLPEGIQEMALPPREMPLESMSVRGGMLRMNFRGLGTISARRFVMNLSWFQLRALSLACPALWEAVNERELRAPHALCPLRITVKAEAIPWTARPLTILFDSDEIPDVDAEVWPMVLRPAGENGCELEAWASVGREISLDEALDCLREAYRRVARLFPFVDASLSSINIPLSMESCFSEGQRRAVLDELEADIVERYEISSFHTATRQKGLFALMPSLHCHLPYPVGPLYEARKLLEQFLGKKRMEEAGKSPGVTV